jgi:type VI secretion system protein ImpA
MSTLAPSLVDELLQPLPGENPSGVSLRYEPIYDKIKELRRFPEAGTGSGIPEYDHKAVIKLATDALSKKSKDLQLAVWLVDAWITRDGFGGLLTGVRLLNGLVANFWDTVYPEIEDGDAFARTALLEWFGNYLELAKGSSPLLAIRLVPLTGNGIGWIRYQESLAKPEPGKLTADEFNAAFESTPKPFYKKQHADLTACLEELDALSHLCDEKFGSDGPSFSKLHRSLEEIGNTVEILLKRKLEKDPDPVELPPPPEPGAEGEAGAETASAGGGFSLATFDGDVSGLEPKSGPEAIARILAAAHFMRRQSPGNPAPYLVLRALRWGELRAKGTDLDLGLLTAPPTEIRTRIRTLSVAGRWADLLEVTEQAMGTECGRGWLDLQRYAVTACDKLQHAAVGTALRSELKNLLADFPGLLKATLLDDTGAANPDTAAWIADGMPKKD